MTTDMQQTWDRSFEEQIRSSAYNTSPVEAVIRTVSYYLRDRYDDSQRRNLHFLEMGCGAAPTLEWLAEKGIRVSGIDISPVALELGRRNLAASGHEDRIGDMLEGSVTETPFDDESFDGIVESCVFQHLDKAGRRRAFDEVRRLLKPGGVFVGYMLDRGHSVYQAKQSEELAEDPGTLVLNDSGNPIHLTGVGLSHFYDDAELRELLDGFTVIDPCLTTYYLPKEEAAKRGYESYLQSMWTVYAVK